MATIKKIAIIGMGVVGKGMERLLECRFEIVPYDIGGSKDAVNQCDMAIVCVPTPMRPDGSCDTSIVEEVVSWLKTPLILIKSTIPPGTTKMFREKYGKKVNFSPEYMGESKYFTPYWKYPDPERAETHTFVIVGGDEASEILNVFMKVMSVDTHYIPTTAEEAELTKYMENSFFATKVSFCNEFFEIAKRYNVDYKRLRELWLLDSRINPNHTLVFEDNRGWAGKCYPKDMNAIIKAAETAGYNPVLLKAVVAQNALIRGEEQPARNLLLPIANLQFPGIEFSRMEQKTNNGAQNGGKSNKTLWFSMLGALLLIILVVAAPRLKRDGSPVEAPSDGSEVADAEVTLSNGNTAAPKPLTKADAVIRYEGRRIEFGENCQATPATVSVKTGTSVMLDNQSGTPRTVKVAGKTFAIGAYKYRTLVLDAPGALPVSCDTTENAAAIIVE